MNQRIAAHGVTVWSDGAWLYRSRGGVVRCIGAAEDGFTVLQHGSVLVRDDSGWIAGAAPHGSCRALALELALDAPLTLFSAGRLLLSRDADDMEVLFDLGRGRAVELLGPTVAGPDRWATVHWDTGRGRWFDPLTAQVLGTFTVPVADDDVLVAGELGEDGVQWRTAEGRVLATPPISR